MTLLLVNAANTNFHYFGICTFTSTSMWTSDGGALSKRVCGGPYQALSKLVAAFFVRQVAAARVAGALLRRVGLRHTNCCSGLWD